MARRDDLLNGALVHLANAGDGGSKMKAAQISSSASTVERINTANKYTTSTQRLLPNAASDSICNRVG